eukprot:scaffold36871_cov49-Phaeocystis_antarctica.AAC.4
MSIGTCQAAQPCFGCRAAAHSRVFTPSPLTSRAGRGAASRHPLDEPPPRGPLPSRKEGTCDDAGCEGVERRQRTQRARGEVACMTQGWGGAGHARSAR